MRGWIRALILVLLLWGPVAADARRTPVVQAVERVKGAVVNISTESVKESAGAPFVFQDPVFQEFFGNFFPEFRRTYRTRSLGSGVIVDRRGHVMTNAHVVDGADRIMVFLADSRGFEARTIGIDRRSDIAVLEMLDPPADLRPASLGDSSRLLIGEPVIAIGNPFGFSHSVTTGIVSALGRTIREEQSIFSNLIQTDTMINPGNSGGPLLNIHGEVIGINTAIYRKAQGIGFAIPVNQASRIYQYLLDQGQLRRGWLGVEIQELSDAMRELLGSHRLAYGVLVADVLDNGLAEHIRQQDVILRIDGTPVTGPEHFWSILYGYPPGSNLRLDLIRDGREHQVELRTRGMAPEYGLRVADDWWGLQFSAYKDKALAVQRVRSGSWADRTGLQRGDLLVAIDALRITSAEDLAEAVLEARARGGGKMEIMRGRQSAIVEF